MGSMLIVDGDNTPSADQDAIQRGFESIEPGNWWSKSLSIVELCRDESHSLTMSGHPVEGWGYLQVVNGDQEKVSFPKPPLPQSRAIEIMQTYHSGDNTWMAEFKWDQMETFKPSGWTTLRNIVVMIGVFALLVYLLRWFRLF